MNRLVVIQHLTLDGVMQAPGAADEDPRDGFGHGGWAQPGDDPVMANVMGEHMGTPWSLLLGRRTYERFAAFWPTQEGNPFAEALAEVQKYVASRSLAEPLPWRNSTLLKGDAEDAVADLKDRLDHNLVVFGSGDLLRTLMARGLVDEYVLQIHPLVLGEGRRLFPEGAPGASLRLTRSITTGTGVVIAVYRPDGA
ncbi:dihydrofolate reductase family protein [Spirillospora sp. NPDC127200]